MIGIAERWFSLGRFPVGFDGCDFPFLPAQNITYTMSCGGLCMFSHPSDQVFVSPLEQRKRGYSILIGRSPHLVTDTYFDRRRPWSDIDNLDGSGAMATISGISTQMSGEQLSRLFPLRLKLYVFFSPALLTLFSRSYPSSIASKQPLRERIPPTLSQ